MAARTLKPENQSANVWPRGEPAVGDRAERSRQVTARDIEVFTEISGDRNPLHYDEEFARATKFGGIIVQGGVTTAILNAVAAEDLPRPGSVFLNVNWNFRAPVRPGDRITGGHRPRRAERQAGQQALDDGHPAGWSRGGRWQGALLHHAAPDRRGSRRAVSAPWRVLSAHAYIPVLAKVKRAPAR